MKRGAEREQVIKRKNATDESVKVVEEQSMYRFNLLLIWRKKSIKTDRPHNKEILWECDKLVFWAVAHLEVR